MDWTWGWQIIGSIAIAVIGYLFERWRERKARLHERKENLYKNLLYSIKGFFIGRTEFSAKEEFVDETRLARLYASDKAIQALDTFLDHLMKKEEVFNNESGENYQETAKKFLGVFILAMRNDLGIKTKLSAEELGRIEIAK